MGVGIGTGMTPLKELTRHSCLILLSLTVKCAKKIIDLSSVVVPQHPGNYGATLEISLKFPQTYNIMAPGNLQVRRGTLLSRLGLYVLQLNWTRSIVLDIMWPDVPVNLTSIP